MDQLKTQLAAIKQHSFWIMCLGILGVTIGSWWYSTGTLKADGNVGPVGSIPDKIRAASREGYRTILIPAGQLSSPEWNLVRLGMELNVDLKEVSTIEEAYRLMTGRAF